MDFPAQFSWRYRELVWLTWLYYQATLNTNLEYSMQPLMWTMSQRSKTVCVCVCLVCLNGIGIKTSDPFYFFHGCPYLTTWSCFMNRWCHFCAERCTILSYGTLAYCTSKKHSTIISWQHWRYSSQLVLHNWLSLLWHLLYGTALIFSLWNTNWISHSFY